MSKLSMSLVVRRLRAEPLPPTLEETAFAEAFRRQRREAFGFAVPWCGVWACGGLVFIFGSVMASGDLDIVLWHQWFCLLLFFFAAVTMKKVWGFRSRFDKPFAWYCGLMLLLALFILRTASVNVVASLVSIFACFGIRVALSAVILNLGIAIFCNLVYTLIVLLVMANFSGSWSDAGLVPALFFGEIMSLMTVLGCAVFAIRIVHDHVQLQLTTRDTLVEQEMMARLINVACEAAVEISEDLVATENLRLLGLDSFTNFAKILEFEDQEDDGGYALDAMLVPQELHRLQGLLFHDGPLISVFSFATTLHGKGQPKNVVLLFSVADLPTGQRILMGVRDFVSGYSRLVGGLDEADFLRTRQAGASRKASQRQQKRGLGTQPIAERQSLSAGEEADPQESPNRSMMRIATRQKSMQYGLLELVSMWSCLKSQKDCCTFHATTSALNKAARSLNAWKCRQAWEPDGDAQCMECGVLAFWPENSETSPLLCAACDSWAVVHLKIASCKVFATENVEEGCDPEKDGPSEDEAASEGGSSLDETNVDNQTPVVEATQYGAATPDDLERLPVHL